MVPRRFRHAAFLSVLLLAACGGPPPYTGGDVGDLQRIDVAVGQGDPATGYLTSDQLKALQRQTRG